MEKESLRNYFINDLGWGWDYQAKIIFQFLCEAASEAKGGVILDAGAGHQRYKPFFDSSIYVAQEHPVAGSQNKGIKEYDILSDVKEIPLQDCSIDIVLSTSSLEHMEFPESFFSESFRVLKPGGSLFVNVPFAYHEHEAPFDFQRPTRYGLRRYYSHAGFEKIRVLPSSSSLYAAQYLFNCAIAEEAARLPGRSSLPVKAAIKAMSATSRSVTSVFMRLLDKGPADDTSLPIGWVSKGCKPGAKSACQPWSSRQACIASTAKLGDKYVLTDGRIVPRQYS